MITTNKKYYILIIYAIYSVCNFQIANCESLSDVSTSTLTKIDKPLGWLFIISSTIFCGYLIYKGVYSYDAVNITTTPTDSILSTPQYTIPAISSKTFKAPKAELTNTLTNSEYLKTLQDITKYY